jgi:hypothetical protein
MEEALRIWERKILRKVYGPKRDTNGWRICTNKKLQDQYRRFQVLTAASMMFRVVGWVIKAG